jgi:outer membrane protein OmpA-like peptidoglycan-associated protein
MRTRVMALALVAALATGAASAQERARSVLGNEATQEDVTRSLRSIVVTPIGPAGSGAPQEVSLMIPIEFEFAKATLTPAAQSRLRMIALAMNDAQVQATRFRIEGHTDSIGGLEPNLRLSQRRAASVVGFLAGQGVDPRRLDQAGYGQTRPLPNIAPNDGRNRRVEFVRAQ